MEVAAVLVADVLVQRKVGVPLGDSYFSAPKAKRQVHYKLKNKKKLGHK